MVIGEFKGEFKSMTDYHNRFWQRKDRGKEFVGGLRRTINMPLAADDDPENEAHDKKYKPSDALRERFHEAKIDADERLDNQCRVRFTKLRECLTEEARRRVGNLSSSATSKSIRLIFGRIVFSRRVLEARQKSPVHSVQLRAH